MRTRRNGAAIVVAAVVAGATALSLAGCVQPPPHVIPTSTSSTAPVFASDAAALAAAKKAYVAYLAVSDQILIDGGKDPKRLLTVATPAELRNQMPGFEAEATKHWRSTGGTRIDAISLQSFDQSTRGSQAIVTVYACIDVSGVDVLDQDGRSVVSSSRPKASTFQATFDLATHGPPQLMMANEQPWQGKGICPS